MERSSWDRWDWIRRRWKGRGVTLDLIGDDRTVQRLLAVASDAFTGPALIADGGAIAYPDLATVAARAGGALAAHGVGPQDRVVAVGANSMALLEVFLGCAVLGAIFVPLNPDYPDAQIAHFTRYVDPALVLADDPATVGRALQGLDLPVACLRGPQAGYPGWELADPIDAEPVEPGTPLAILMTSGTTGVSKGVVCPHGQFVQWGQSVGDLLGLQPGDVAYSCLPMFHTNALNGSIQALIHGAVFHSGPRFSVSRFFDRIREADASVSYLLGAMVGMLLTAPERPDDREHRLTRILAPGTPVPAVEAFEARFGIRLIEGHGMTETNLVIAPLGEERRLGFMGTVVPGFEVKVVDDEGRDTGPGVPGELLLRTGIAHGFASGYWQMPEATQAATRDGWFRTGDRVVEDRGWYRFLDRIKDVIRRRGENISAWEVEQVLDAFPGVSQSAVVPVPADLGEDEVMAFVRLVENTAADPLALATFAAERLPSFAVPRYVEFVGELPLTDTGKVRKQVLRERGRGPQTWDRLAAESASR